MEKKCPQCGAQLPPTALRCRSCNLNLLTSPRDADQIKCPKCAHHFVTGLTCPNCNFTFEGGYSPEARLVDRQNVLNSKFRKERTKGSWAPAFRIAILVILVSSVISFLSWTIFIVTLSY
jgi:hypothetical protein